MASLGAAARSAELLRLVNASTTSKVDVSSISILGQLFPTDESKYGFLRRLRQNAGTAKVETDFDRLQFKVKATLTQDELALSLGTEPQMTRRDVEQTVMSAMQRQHVMSQDPTERPMPDLGEATDRTLEHLFGTQHGSSQSIDQLTARDVERLFDRHIRRAGPDSARAPIKMERCEDGDAPTDMREFLRNKEAALMAIGLMGDFPMTTDENTYCMPLDAVGRLREFMTQDQEQKLTENRQRMETMLQEVTRKTQDAVKAIIPDIGAVARQMYAAQG